MKKNGLLMSVLASFIFMVASSGATSYCWIMGYQPEVPEKLK